MLSMLRSPVRRYGFAVVSVIAATLLRLVLNPVLGDGQFPFVTYFLAVALTGWACGWWPALLSVWLSVLAAAYFFVLPRHSLALIQIEDILGLGLFLAVGVLMALFSEAMHRAQRRAEAASEALSESREQLATTLKSIGDAVIATDAHGIVTFMNGVAQSLTGWQLPQAKGRRLEEVFKIVNEQTRQAVESPVAKVIREDKVVGLANHTILLAKDGREIPIDDSGAPIKNEQGELTGVVLVFHDITERRHGEDSLRKSEERYRAFVENSSEAIWRCELEPPVSIDLPEDEFIAQCFRNGYLAECNDVMAGMYGFKSAQEIVGTPLSDLLIPTDAANIEYLRTFIRSGFRLAEAESHEIDREGREKYFLNNLVGIIENRLLLRTWGTQRDITERQRAEQERAQLLESEQAARRVAEHAAERTARLQAITAALSEALTPAQVASVVLNQGLTALNADAGSVMLLNPQGTELELLDAVNFPPPALEPWRRFSITEHVPLAVAVRSGELVLVESLAAREKLYPTLVALHAQTANQALAAIPLLVGGRAIGAMGFSFRAAQQFTAEDRVFMVAIAHQCAQAITRARLYEAERRSRAEAEVANRTKDEFLATLSHELRTPLTAVLGWAKLLRTLELDEPTAARALETIERNAQAQARLIEELLEVSRVITGKLHLELHPVDIVPVIEAAVDAMRPAAAAKSLSLQTELDPLAGSVAGDPARLQQVVWNLVSNAVKFTKQGGLVQVRLRRANSHLHLSVTDTGEGIKPEFLPFVFERFRQADGSTTRTHGGLGIGLAIVRHLVELHGGTVSVESAGAGQGATFTVQLPLLTSPVPKEDDHAGPPLIEQSALHLSPPTLLAGLRVLVVDDEADTRELIATVLERYGAEVKSVADVRAALLEAKRWQPDLLISDIGMPVEDGYSLIRQLRADGIDPDHKIPAIALTAYAGVEDRLRALTAGFEQHLAKPLEPGELIAAVASLAGRDSKV